MRDSVLFIILRRMRAPLIVLIAAYAVSILGMVLIPGVDGQGMPLNMSFFHAFYFISYTATTIGFGEIPYAFSDAQRLWVVFTIYLTVVAWFYSIGKLVALLQEPRLRQVMAQARFERQVRAVREPYYLVCGYGETGGLLVGALDRRGVRCVVLDIDPDRISEVDLQDYQSFTPALAADARLPEALLLAGIRHDRCRAVVALTNDDQANLSVAMTAKLLHPEVPVLCRVESPEVEAHMRAFGTDHVINPFAGFARHLAMAIEAPGGYLLRRMITDVPGTAPPRPLHPRRGTWVVCGHGRFGREIVRNLREGGIETRVVDLHAQALPEAGGTTGRGDERAVLAQAGIAQAAGLVAGTDNDVTNLAIVMAAREHNPGLFVVLRRNRRSSQPLFGAVGADLVLQRSEIVSEECLAILTSPLMARFLQIARSRGNDWCNEVVSRLIGAAGDTVPDVWDGMISVRETPGLFSGRRLIPGLRLGHLLLDPTRRDQRLDCVPLLLTREGSEYPVPDEDMALQPGDALLFAGTQDALRGQGMLVRDYNLVNYVVTGHELPGGSVWRWIEARRRARA